jgi:flagellar biosynthesis/type III secretory pathway M-ring protein FliF/YscJ
MKPYWRVTLSYLAFGLAWIFFTDRIGEWIVANIHALSFLQTIKGWFFVLLSAILIFVLMRQAFRRLEAEQRKRAALFRKTVEGANHILRNYLNQMQIVTMEAEQSRDFDPEMIKIARRISEEAAGELTKLEEVTTFTSDHVAAVVYRDQRSDSRTATDA